MKKYNLIIFAILIIRNSIKCGDNNNNIKKSIKEEIKCEGDNCKYSGNFLGNFRTNLEENNSELSNFDDKYIFINKENILIFKDSSNVLKL